MEEKQKQKATIGDSNDGGSGNGNAKEVEEEENHQGGAQDPVKKSSTAATPSLDMFSDSAEIPLDVLSKATLDTHDSSNMALKDNWDDTEGYYRTFLHSSFHFDSSNDEFVFENKAKEVNKFY
jgi:hypothetical protein